jgi:hypothetical protein
MIYVFDLDETLCSSLSEIGDYRSAIPIEPRITAVNKLFDAGHHIIIDTARGSASYVTEELRDLTIEQLKKWGVKYHTLRIGIKPIGDYYIDDRAISADDFFRADNDI